MPAWFQIATRKDIVIRSLKVGLIVGSLLTLINYGDILLMGEFVPAMMWKIPLTYCVPFSVSTYASIAAANDGRSN